MNFSKIWSTVFGAFGSRPSTSGGLTTASPYAKSRGGVTDGLNCPRWQVQQVTTCRPPKFVLLMFCTIATMARAVRLRGGSSSHFGFDVPAPVWQLPQQRLNDVVNTPIVPMNSSTGMPLSTWTFLNTLSDICGVAGVAAATCDDDCCCAWSVGIAPVENAMLFSHAIVTVAAEKTAPLENPFMECLQHV